MFPTRIGATICNALIDTGATRSCISEKFYQCLPPFDMQNVGDISVKSATGSNLTPLGMINCSFELGNLRSSCLSKFNSSSHTREGFLNATSHNRTI